MFNNKLVRFLKYVSLFVIIVFAVCENNLIAQNFTNGLNGSVGTYRTRDNRGIIRMYGTPDVAPLVNSDGAFDGENRLGATGDIGTAATGYETSGGRIPGTVIWAKPTIATAQQNAMINVPMFYYNLGVANTGWKVFNEVNVAGTFNRYANDGTTNTFSVDIAHLCTGIFTYDGTILQDVLNTEKANNRTTTDSLDNFYATLKISRPSDIISNGGIDSVVVSKNVFTRNLNITEYAKLGIADVATSQPIDVNATARLVIDAVATPYNVLLSLQGNCPNLFTSTIDGELYINTWGAISTPLGLTTGRYSYINSPCAFFVNNNTEIYISATGKLVDQWTIVHPNIPAVLDRMPSFYFHTGGEYVAGANVSYSGGVATMNGTNANYPSTVRYATNGSGSTAGIVMQTFGSYPYGRLVIEGDNDLILAGNVYIAGEADDAFYFIGNGNLYTGELIQSSDKIWEWENSGITCPATTLTHQVYSNEVVFNGSRSLSKFDGSGEIIGWITRREFVPEYQYIWNNAATKFAVGNGGNAAQTPSTLTSAIQYNPLSFQTIPGIDVGHGVPTASTGSTNEISLAKSPADGTGYINRVFEIRYVGDKLYFPLYMTDIQLGFKPNDGGNEIQNAMKDANTNNVDWASVRGFEGWLGMEEEISPLSGDLGWVNNSSGKIEQSINKAKWTPVGYVATDNTINTNVAGIGFAAMELKSGVDDGKIYLAMDRADDDGSTLISCSQIIFGNQPMLLVSRQNGRWSNPATWGDVYANNIGMTPTAVDSVIIANVVYTGWYEGAGAANNIFGIGGYGVNEYNLPGVQLTAGITLAKAVTILSIDSANIRYPDNATERTKWGVALVIGNGEGTKNTGADLTAEDAIYNPAVGSILPSAMKYGTSTAPSPNGIGIPLLFGNIYNLGAYNKYPLPGDPPIENATIDLQINNSFWGNLTNPGVGYYALTGLYITDGMYTTSGNPYSNTITGPIINPINIINAGDIVNNSILDIGRQHINP